MNILVTGGFGFIGTHLSERLLKEKQSITIIDIQTSVGYSNFNNKINSYKIDVSDNKCEQIFADTHFDVVFHLACKEIPQQDPVEAGRVLNANITGLSNILFLSQKYHVSKVIVLSSYQVYGHQTTLPIQEDAQLKPFDMVGRYFQTVEACCAACCQCGMNIVLLRIGEIYGPRQGCHPGHDFQALVDSWFSFQPLSPSAFNNQRKDYIFINDVIEAMIRAAENETDPILNIACGQGTTLKELSAICTRIFGYPIEQKLAKLVDQRTSNPDSLGESGPESHSDSPWTKDERSAGLPVVIEPDFILDCRRASFALDWTPKYSLETGIRKTIERAEKDILQTLQKTNTKEPKKPAARTWHLFRFKTHPDIDNIIVFIFMTLATFLFEARLGINLDLLILYVVLINLFYGLKQGGMAIALAIAARIGLMFFVQGVHIIDLANDVNRIMNLTLYFVLGVGIGYVMDNIRQGKFYLEQELDEVKNRLEFVQQMYQRSLAIKQSLQATIESNSDSLSKALVTVSRLEQVEPELVYEEASRILAEVLKINCVHIYQVNENGEWLRLAANIGVIRYNHSINTVQHEFLIPVINQQTININKALDPDVPMICAPVVTNGRTIAVIFIDGIDFTQLNQGFLNNLKVMSHLLVHSLSKIAEDDKLLQPVKYFQETQILRQEWFAKLLESSDFASGQYHHSYLQLKIVNNIDNYHAFYKKIAGLIRRNDHLGEIGQGQLSLILTQVEDRDIPTIFQRFAERGYILETLNRGENAS